MGGCAGKPEDRPKGKENELRPKQGPKDHEKVVIPQPQPTHPVETDKKPSSIVNPPLEEPKANSSIKAPSAIKQAPSPKVQPAESIEKQVHELIEKSKAGLIPLKDSRADHNVSAFKAVEEEDDEKVADEEVVNFRSDIVNFNLGVTVQ